MRRVTVFAAMLLIALMVTALADDMTATVRNKLRTFKGTWTCLACDLKNLKGERAQCELFGHKHALRLDNGKYITFLENDHSVDLIKGGGRHSTRIEVTGYYDSNSRTLDVVSYTIDGKLTAWCPQHQLMDLCANSKDKTETEVSQATGE